MPQGHLKNYKHQRKCLRCKQLFATMVNRQRYCIKCSRWIQRVIKNETKTNNKMSEM